MADRYKNIVLTKTSRGVPYRVTTIYPDIPLSEDDIYVIATSNDRYDLIAQQYYGDSSLWWVIASANIFNRGTLNIPQGRQIRIPADKNQAIQLFNEANKKR